AEPVARSRRTRPRARSLRSGRIVRTRRNWVGELTADKVKSLQAALSGTVSVAGDAGYDVACSIWNGAIDRRPAVVASCATSADVAAALAFARDEDLEVSVRGGGHNYAGFALCHG